MTFMPVREELAWAAGFFDGEGSTGNSKGSKNSLRMDLQVAQVEFAPLQRFQAAVGVGKVRGPYHSGKPKESPYYQWATRSFEDCQAALAMLLPFMCAPKREQAMSALRRYHEVWNQYGYGRRYCSRNHDTRAPRGRTKAGQCRLCSNENMQRYRQAAREAKLHPVLDIQFGSSG